jgi:hypothetical protein
VACALDQPGSIANVMKGETEMKALSEGTYTAICKEKNFLAAAMNGHSLVFPEARCTVAKGSAVFDRDGVELWRCNAEYAAVHIILKPIG